VPQRHEHLARALENETLAESTLDPAKGVCVDWAITMLFYAGLHYVDAYLTQSAGRPKSHQQRDRIIETNGSLSPIWEDYRRLKDISEQARYQIAAYDESKMVLARQRLHNIKSHLKTKGLSEIVL
jgi:hypothetical protein